MAEGANSSNLRVSSVISLADEVAGNTDRQDDGLTTRRFDEEESVTDEEEIFEELECDIALADNNDEDEVCFDPLNPELDLVEVKEEHDFDEEPAIKIEPSSADEEVASNTDRHEDGLTMRRLDGKESELGSCAESDDSALEDNNGGEKKYPCNLCNYMATQSGHLSTHMRTHTGERPYPCKRCNYKASVLGDLTRHMRTHTGEKPYQCKLCKYKTSQPGTLSRHMRTHTGEKLYKCQLCNYKAAQPGHLSNHMRTHTGEKPFSCQQCDYKANHPTHLSMHMRTHTGERPYPCQYCDYRAARNGDLAKHMRTHTGERPYACQHCDYKAARQGDLTKHMRTHTGERPYSCKLCKYKATQPGHISEHMITHTVKKSSICRSQMIQTHPIAPQLQFQMSLRSKTSDSKGKRPTVADLTSSDTD